MQMTQPSPPVSAQTDTADVVLAARHVTKSFGAVHALKGVNFDIRRGQVTTLFGENGAGKSTLMKILSGVQRPTTGDILLNGQAIRFGSTTEAQELGICIIHQELSLAPNLNVRDNIYMGREIRGPLGVDYAEEDRQVRSLMAELEEDIDPLEKVENLRLGQQQIVEIARALSVNARILIMDEPTSALSAAEVEVLFKVIGDLKTKGVSLVYISHHLEEALTITDHAVVLRDGTMTACAPARRSIWNGSYAIWWARISTLAVHRPAMTSALRLCRSQAWPCPPTTVPGWRLITLTSTFGRVRSSAFTG